MNGVSIHLLQHCGAAAQTFLSGCCAESFAVEREKRERARNRFRTGTQSVCVCKRDRRRDKSDRATEDVHRERLSERDRLLPPNPPGVAESCEKMKRCVIDSSFLHLICSPVAGACLGWRQRRGRGCAELSLRSG